MPAVSEKQREMMAIRAKHPSESNHPEIPMKVASEFDKAPPGKKLPPKMPAAKPKRFDKAGQLAGAHALKQRANRTKSGEMEAVGSESDSY
jgi:hypothetical protein